jgi:hypothetical protein
MKLIEIPVSSLVELQFDFLGAKHKISVGLFYKNADAVYISAIKNMGNTIPASKLKNIDLIYKTDTGVFLFRGVMLSSITVEGQKMYSVVSGQDTPQLNHRNAYRLFIGANVAAKLILPDGCAYINCLLKDISMTGMSLLSNKKIDKLSKIEISFRVNDKMEVLIGNIIHVYEFKNGKGFLYGCEFDEPNVTIGKYVERQQEEFYK